MRSIQDDLHVLSEQDPDYVVDVLEITSAELIDRFYVRAINHLKEEFGGYDDEE
jgi:hypothetical protein